MNQPAFHASPNASRLRRRAVRGVAIGFAAAVLLAYLGALGTWAAPFGHRLAYWAAVILPGSLIGIAVQEVVNAWGRLSGNRAGEIALVALLISVPHSFMVIVASALFFGLAAITPGVVLNFWLAVLVIALVLTAINHLAAVPDGEPLAPSPAAPVSTPVAEARSEPIVSAPPTPETSPLPALPELIAEKLPVRLRQARLIAIEAEDHYLRIHTDAGSDLVLMRMVDACALLPEAAGARVHRSWWAARGSVERLARREGKAELKLQGDLCVPVSRAMQASLREQGWG
jgi:DNA-binding LytR/AlgR family response regulator